MRIRGRSFGYVPWYTSANFPDDGSVYVPEEPAIYRTETTAPVYQENTLLWILAVLAILALAASKEKGEE